MEITTFPLDTQQQGLLFSRQMTLQQSPEKSGDKVIAAFSSTYSQNKQTRSGDLLHLFSLHEVNHSQL